MCHIAIRQSITDYNFLMVCMHNKQYVTEKNYIHTILQRHENDAYRARRARAGPRRQYIAFSVSVLDEWEWMAKRLAILEKVSFAVIPQPPYASTTRETHIQPLLRQHKALFSNFSCSPTAVEAPEV